MSGATRGPKERATRGKREIVSERQRDGVRERETVLFYDVRDLRLLSRSVLGSG